jgi:spore germination protein KB
MKPPLEGGRISPRQMLALVVLSRIVTMTITFPMMTSSGVGRDAWIASLVSGLIALIFSYGMVSVGLRFPDKTILEYSEILLGKVLGKVVNLVLLWYFFHAAVNVTRAFGESLVISILDQTPVVVIMLAFLFLAVNSARNGLEVIARMAENALVVVLFFFLITVTLPYTSMEFGRVLPVLADGLGPVVRSTIISFAFYAELIVFGMVIPYLNKPTEGKKAISRGVILSVFIMTILCVVLTSVFGPTVTSLSLPTFSLGRMISITQFLERIEIFPIGAWTLAAGIKLALLCWALLVGIAQVLGLSDYKPIAYPVGSIILVSSLLFYESNFALENFFMADEFGVYSIGIVVTILILLFCAELIRKDSSEQCSLEEGKR